MSDHQRLTEVWQLELMRRQRQDELNRWSGIFDQRRETIQDAHRQIEAGEQRFGEIEVQLAAWETDLKTLERRIGLVEQGIQRGSMQDLDQAQAQISGFREKVDEIELAYLEGLEEQERIRFNQAMGRDTIKVTEQMLTAEQTQFVPIRTVMMTELSDIQSRTADLLNIMNPTVAGRYRLMLTKIEKPVVGVVMGRVCGGCYMELPTELAWTATQRDLIVHCPTCGVFLLPEEPSLEG